ncbi:MAG: GPW/gp25 family protein [Rhizomicrobium sp.]
MAGVENSFLGRGWSFPPTFSRRDYGVAMVKDEVDVRESLWILLSTLLGERVMVPGYGTDLWRMVFRNLNTTLTTQIQEMVAQAILYWEPRIVVDNIQLDQDATRYGVVLLNIDYTIRMTNARNNLVYPYYTQEMTIPQPPV